MHYFFEWDPRKAAANRRKHGVSFHQAATVMLDPRAISIYDTEHSTDEERWLTLGISSSGGLLVVHHTYQQIDASSAQVRIISSRKATRHEIDKYAGTGP
jgi:uncharacterized DUF497 family protein